MESNIIVYILMVYVLLLFLFMVILWEKFKNSIQTILEKKFPLLKRISWDTVIKGLAVAGFILFARKLIYYVPFAGVIQTKSSIWWVEEKTQILLIIFILILFVIGLGWELEWQVKEKGFGVFTTVLVGVIAVAFTLIYSAYTGKFPITGRELILLIFSPFVLLKMVSSGKYLGLLTGFLVGYLIVVGYKKLKKGRIKHHRSMMIAAWFMFLILIGFIFYQSSRNWQERFQHNVQSAQSPGEIEELLDVVNTIDNEYTKSNALQQLAAAIAGTGDSQWQKKTFQQAIRTTEPIENSTQRSKVLKEIFVSIGKTGDIPWAISVAESIPDRMIRNNVLKELREKIERK